MKMLRPYVRDERGCVPLLCVSCSRIDGQDCIIKSKTYKCQDCIRKEGEG